MEGESRYILHPSTVDACLQLIIISIHAGLHKTMPWGVVPIEIEEASFYFYGNVSETRGSAVAWADKLEGRYFNTHTKLQDSDGHLVLDIKGLRCVAYEAAVPQNAQGGILRQPYAGITWKHDIETLSTLQAFPENQSEFEAIATIVDLIDHKTLVTSIRCWIRLWRCPGRNSQDCSCQCFDFIF